MPVRKTSTPPVEATTRVTLGPIPCDVDAGKKVHLKAPYGDTPVVFVTAKPRRSGEYVTVRVPRSMTVPLPLVLPEELLLVVIRALLKGVEGVVGYWRFSILSHECQRLCVAATTLDGGNDCTHPPLCATLLRHVPVDSQLYAHRPSDLDRRGTLYYANVPPHTRYAIPDPADPSEDKHTEQWKLFFHGPDNEIADGTDDEHPSACYAGSVGGYHVAEDPLYENEVTTVLGAPCHAIVHTRPLTSKGDVATLPSVPGGVYSGCVRLFRDSRRLEVCLFAQTAYAGIGVRSTYDTARFLSAIEHHLAYEQVCVPLAANLDVKAWSGPMMEDASATALSNNVATVAFVADRFTRSGSLTHLAQNFPNEPWMRVQDSSHPPLSFRVVKSRGKRMLACFLPGAHGAFHTLDAALVHSAYNSPLDPRHASTFDAQGTPLYSGVLPESDEVGQQPHILFELEMLRNITGLHVHEERSVRVASRNARRRVALDAFTLACGEHQDDDDRSSDESDSDTSHQDSDDGNWSQDGSDDDDEMPSADEADPSDEEEEEEQTSSSDEDDE